MGRVIAFKILVPIVVIVAILAGVSAAQAPGAGGRAPRPPVTMHPHDLDASFIRMPLPAGQEKYGGLDGEHIKQFDREIVSVSRKSKEDGELLWGRVAGTKYDDMVEGIVESKFKQFGLQDVHRQYFDLPPQWFPTAWEFSATSGGKALRFESARAATGSPSTPSAGLDLEPVWVGLGTASDFVGRDVKGKLVIVQSMPMPGVVSHSATYNGSARRAAENGAAAVVLNVAIPGNLQVQIGFNSGLPTFTMGTEDATALREAMEHGPVKVHMRLATEQRAGLRDASVWGSLPGTTDEDIIIMAHHDAYFEGALDNASGMAVMLGLAEYYSKIPQSQRRRTIKFVTTSGHHAGSFGTAWMHSNRTTFLAKTALVINCEHVSIAQTYFDRSGPFLHNSDNIDARRWWVNGSSKLATTALNAWKMFGVTIYDTMDATTTGDMSAIDRDVPSIQLIESATYYHTDHDVPSVVPAPGLESVARSYAKIIDQVNMLDRAALMPVPPTTTSGIGR
jgi:hypothetical protein